MIMTWYIARTLKEKDGALRTYPVQNEWTARGPQKLDAPCTRHVRGHLSRAERLLLF